MKSAYVAAVSAVLTVAAPLPDPRVVSAHPFAGTRGASFSVALRGEGIRDASAASFTSKGLSASIERFEEEPPSGRNKKPSDVVHLKVQATSEAALGSHAVRLVTPRGISNAVSLYLADGPILVEPGTLSPADHFVTGRIGTRGETDSYIFEAEAGELVTFETISGLPAPGAPGGNANGFDPSLAIYEASGSWFDASRLNRIAFNDEPLWVIGQPTDARLSHRFRKAGRYVLRLEAFSGQGGPDYSYLLKISRGEQADPAKKAKGGWEERSFLRRLSSDRLTQLAARGKAQQLPAAETYRPGATVKLPAVIEGGIGEPGEAHRAQFKIDGPQDIAIEVETPDLPPPEFNPIVRLLREGEEVATTVFVGRGACTGAMFKSIQSKVIVPLRDPGEYTIEIRDTTADLAGPRFQYRVMVRPQVAHLGQIAIAEDRINLTPGAARPIRVTFDREEDYRGAVAVSAEGLPAGITALAGADFEPDKDPPSYASKRERYTPRTERTVIVFTAADDAPVTPDPVMAKIAVRPLVDGKPGAVIMTKSLPVMVVPKP